MAKNYNNVSLMITLLCVIGVCEVCHVIRIQ